MGRVKKAAKKFKAKGKPNLNNAIQKRKKIGQGNKGKHQQQQGSKQPAVEKASEAHKEEKFAGMSPDDFLNGGFEEDSGHESSDPEDFSDNESFDDNDLIESGSEDGLEQEDDDEEEGSEGPSDDEDDDEDDIEDGSDEEEDDEDDDASPVKKGVDKESKKGSLATHKAQLEALKDKDPEFYKYLQQEDSGLLNIEDEDEEEGEDDDEEEESGDDEEAPRAAKALKNAQLSDEPETEEGEPEVPVYNVTSELVAKWVAAACPEEETAEDKDEEVAIGKAGKRKAAAAAEVPKGKKARKAQEDDDEEVSEEADEDEEEEQEAPKGGKKSLKGKGKQPVSQPAKDGAAKPASKPVPLPALGAMRNLLKAYRLACHYGDPEAGEETSRLRISSSAVYHAVLMAVLKKVPSALKRLLLADGPLSKRPEAEAAAALEKMPRWRKMGALVKSFWGNSLHLLSISTDKAMTAFILRCLRPAVFLLAPLPKLRDKYLKTCLDLFGTSEAVPVRIQSFLAVRAVATTLPQPALDLCLKGFYRTFLSSAKFVNAGSAPHLAFMGACAVDLWGVDMQASYQHGFTAVRQLAVLLRSALALKTADAFRAVYCWQTVNCVELWAKVLGAHADKQELRPLAYPVAQILLGMARLVPSAKYLPLRLRVVRALNRLASQTGLLVPVAPILLEMISWSELRRAPKGGQAGEALPDLQLQLRISASTLRTPTFQEELVRQVLDLLGEHLSLWSTSPAFPELSHLPLVALRRFARESPVERFRRLARQLADTVTRNVVWVGQARDQLECGPRDVAKLQHFLVDQADKAPLQVYVQAALQKAAQRATLRTRDSA